MILLYFISGRDESTMNYTKTELETTTYNTFKIHYDLMNGHMAKDIRDRLIQRFQEPIALSLKGHIMTLEAPRNSASTEAVRIIERFINDYVN